MTLTWIVTCQIQLSLTLIQLQFKTDSRRRHDVASFTLRETSTMSLHLKLSESVKLYEFWQRTQGQIDALVMS